MENSNNNNDDYQKLVRVLCHDLNNSIGIVKNSIKLIGKMGDHPHEKFPKTMQKISRAVDNITELLNSVKDYEAIKSGKKEFELVNVNFDEILKNTDFTFSDKASEKNIKLDLINNIPEGNFLKIEGSAFKNSVINNLVSNALKFSKEGDTILVKGEIDGDNIKITVKDQGIGIPKKIQDNLFNPNVSTTRDGTSGEKGTGFGMPLVKTYVERFGGTISVESRDIQDDPDNHGTSMIILLPISK